MLQDDEASEKTSRVTALNLLRERALACDLHTLAAHFGITVRTERGLNKGWAGQTLERIADLTNSNLPSRDGSDFELKSVKMVLQGGGYVPRETVKITSLNPQKIIEETFESSVLWNKLQRLVIVGCEYSAPEKARAVFIGAFDIGRSELVNEIRAMWEDVQHLVMNGEIGQHFNLGSSSELIQIRPQGDGKQLSKCPVSGDKFPARAFYATRRLLNEILKTGFDELG